MKLRKYEIDAITSKTKELILEQIKIPDFSKELKQHEKVIKEFNKAAHLHNEDSKKLRKILSKSPIKTDFYVRTVSLLEYDEENILKRLKRDYLNKKIPPSAVIQQEIILSSKTDLVEIVDTIVKKFV